MGLLRRGLYTVSITTLMFFGLNHSWAHAALVNAVSETDCAPNLEIEARREIAEYYGEVQASPVMACMHRSILGLKVSHGTTRFAPFMPPIIILGPQGQNSDVASHEYSHAELAYRTSPLLRTYRIPTWFDEGLAMQLDHRNDYSEEALQGYLNKGIKSYLSLNQLYRPKDFYVKGDEGKTHYAFSKCVISHWMNEEGQNGLNDAISSVGWFSKFPTSRYKKHETDCSANPS